MCSLITFHLPQPLRNIIPRKHAYLEPSARTGRGKEQKSKAITAIFLWFWNNLRISGKLKVFLRTAAVKSKSRHTQTKGDNKFWTIPKLHAEILHHKDMFTSLDSESQQIPMPTHESILIYKRKWQHMRHLVFTYALLNQAARLLSTTPHYFNVLNRRVAFYKSEVGFLMQNTPLWRLTTWNLNTSSLLKVMDSS